jgi:hypothetical protein
MKDFPRIPSVIIVQLREICVALPTRKALRTEFIVFNTLQLLGEYLMPDLAIEGGRASLLGLEDPLHGLLEVLSLLDGGAEFISVTFQVLLIEAWGPLIHHALISSIKSHPTVLMLMIAMHV